MPDNDIWNLVAFLKAMPTLDSATYRKLVDKSAGHSHGPTTEVEANKRRTIDGEAAQASIDRRGDDMDETGHALEDDVSAVFERACNEQDLAVAEHLLRALELIAQRDEQQTERLQRALLRLARTLPPPQTTS